MGQGAGPGKELTEGDFHAFRLRRLRPLPSHPPPSAASRRPRPARPVAARPAARRSAAGRKARAKSVIFLHQCGGPSHHDTFDMKPDAPDRDPRRVQAHRHAASPASRSANACRAWPGSWTRSRSSAACATDEEPQLGRLLQPHRLRPADRRSAAARLARPVPRLRLRRRSRSPRPAPACRPSSPIPYVIRDGSITPGQHASFLGKAHDPLFIGQDPNGPDFRLPELSLPDNLTPERLGQPPRDDAADRSSRRELLEFSARARGIDDDLRARP